MNNFLSKRSLTVALEM